MGCCSKLIYLLEVCLFVVWAALLLVPHPANPPPLLGSRRLLMGFQSVEVGVVLWQFASPAAHVTAAIKNKKPSRKTNEDRVALGFTSCLHKKLY